MTPVLPVLKRALASRCPACGKASIFQSFFHLKVSCTECGLALREREGNTWFFMYISTAAITGVFLLAMLAFVPAHQTWGRVVIAISALAVFVGTIPIRKSLAIAFDYLV